MRFVTNKDENMEAKAMNMIDSGLKMAETQIQTERCKAAIECIKEMKACGVMSAEDAGRSLTEVMELLGFETII